MGYIEEADYFLELSAQSVCVYRTVISTRLPPPPSRPQRHGGTVCLLFWPVFLPYNCSYFIFICFKGGMKWADKSCRAEMTSAMTSAMPLQLWSIDPSFWLFPRGFSRSPLFICMVCFYANSNQTNILITHLDFYKITFVDDQQEVNEDAPKMPAGCVAHMYCLSRNIFNNDRQTLGAQSIYGWRPRRRSWRRCLQVCP